MLSKEGAKKLRDQGLDVELVNGIHIKVMTPEAREAEARGAQIAEEFSHSADGILDPIEQEINTQPINSGLSVTRRVDENPYLSLQGGPRGLYNHLPEAEHKRLSMALKLRRIKSQMASLGAQLGQLVMEMEDARMESTGVRLPDTLKQPPTSR